jgi:hypothetical protein
MAANQIIYIASHLFSGSTWLSYVLGSHSQAATLGEHHRRFEGGREIDCRHCRLRGLPCCEVLHGINEAPISEAYSLPLFRFSTQGVTSLIDNSKKISWLKQLIDDGACEGVSVRVIHLLRDPRGWIASCLSRDPSLSVDGFLADWRYRVELHQRELAEVGLPVLNLCYDLLCLNPQPWLGAVSRFTGLDYGMEHFAYWNRIHHSLGANGAAINVLPDRFGNAPDRDYYLARFRRPFHDDRWRHSPDANVFAQISLDAGADFLLEAFGGGFSEIDRLLSLSVSESQSF